MTVQTTQAPSAPASGPDAQQCAALLSSEFEGLPGAPTRITAARVVDVAPAPPEAPPNSAVAVLAASSIKQYCQVLGYAAPQNKFELRLPLPSQWNGKFHLTPCAGFCGTLNGNACNVTLARGYASITGNGVAFTTMTLSSWRLGCQQPEPSGGLCLAA